jgi:hypothetical protein
VKESVGGKQNQMGVHFVVMRRLKAPRTHAVHGRTRLSSHAVAALTGFIFMSYVSVSAENPEIPILPKVSQGFWKKVDQSSTDFIQYTNVQSALGVSYPFLCPVTTPS